MGLYKKILVWNLSLAAAGFLILTIYRMTLEYNDEGFYVGDEATYSEDAILAYASLSCSFLLIAILIRRYWKVDRN